MAKEYQNHFNSGQAEYGVLDEVLGQIEAEGIAIKPYTEELILNLLKTVVELRARVSELEKNK